MTDPRLPLSDDAPAHPWADDAAAYALDALPPEERAAFEAHLADCADCLRAVREHRETAALLARGVPAAVPPRALRDRIVDAARAAPNVDGQVTAASAPAAVAPASVPVSVPAEPRVLPQESRRTRAGRLPWLAAAAAAALAVGLGVQWDRERGARGRLERELVAQRDAIATRDSLLALVLAPEVRTARLTATGSAPSVRVYWNRARNTVVLTASALPRAASGRTYQLWGIAPGGPPVSLGTFDTDVEGRARAVLRIPAGTTMEVAAITDEPAGGSPQPTTTPFLTGSLKGDE